MTQTLTLTDFLLARIAEDENAAREATSGPWTAYGDGVLLGASENPEVCRQVKTWNMWHLSLHDPLRVLAECDAKRRIVENTKAAREACGRAPLSEQVSSSDGPATSYWRGQDWACRVLALPYADHPDYDERWRV